MEMCKDLIPHKSYPWHGQVILLLFIISGSILIGITTDLGNAVNFRCNPDKNIGADLTQKTFIQTSCLSKYEETYDSPIPLHWYMILSFGLVLSLSLVYAVGVKSRIGKFDASEAPTNDIEVQTLQQTSSSGFTGHRLNTKSCIPVFYIYFAQLLFVRVILPTLFAGLIFFPSHFPSEFSCPWSSPSLNITQDSLGQSNSTTLTVECKNPVASKTKTLAIAVGTVNIVFALIALPEAIYLVWKVCGNKSFSSDEEFCSVFLLRKREVLNKNNFNRWLDTIIDYYKKQFKTSDCTFNMDIQYASKGTLDSMYVPLIIQEGRDKMHGAGGERHEIYYAYLKVPNKSLLIHDIEDLFENTTQPPQKILVIGSPGIGKSILAKKILFNWTKEAREFHKEKIVILLKFRSFNSEQTKLKSLKEMLKIGIGLPDDDGNFDCLFQYIMKNPEKVVLIFDGLDELKVDSDCVEKAQNVPNDHCKSMSIFSVWCKLITKAFLPGAYVITTSRPTADHIFSKLSRSFDKTLEILGFTESEIQEYVQNFCEDKELESDIIWRYIKASPELLSLCYVPVNNYIVCLTLERCESTSEVSIPRTLTELYKRAIRILLWDHHPACKSVTKKKDYLNSNKYFPEEVIELLDKLKFLAKDGMENNKLIFNREDIGSIEDCGLFNSLPNEHESQFCFLHLTLQEFLAAWKLVDDCSNRSDVDKVLSKYLQKPRWHLVIQFFAGLLGDKVKEGRLPEDCYECFSKRIPPDVTDWPTTLMRDVLLMIKCLHELQDPEIVASTAAEVMCKNELEFRGRDTFRIAPADCTALAQFVMHIKNLHRLDLSYHVLGDTGVRELVKVFENKCNEVTEVNLCANKITAEGVQELCCAMRNENCKLTSIKLMFNQITYIGVQDLCCALKDGNCKLTSIDLSHNRVTDEGVQDLCCALKNENCKLTSIYLRQCNITDEGVQHLCFALKDGTCKLTSIGLGGNEITDEGVQDLCCALKNENCKLTSIYLWQSNITDEGVQDLCCALKNENCKLTSIDLGRNKITDESVQDLCCALKNGDCKLTRIYLNGNEITDKGVQGLRCAVKSENSKLEI